MLNVIELFIYVFPVSIILRVSMLITHNNVRNTAKVKTSLSLQLLLLSSVFVQISHDIDHQVIDYICKYCVTG